VSQNVRNTPSGSFTLKTLHYLQDLQSDIKQEQIEQQLGERAGGDKRDRY